jgi:putative phosphoesterase
MSERETLRTLIISDTHGCKDRIAAVIEQAGPYDLLLHAGDHATDVLGIHPNLIAVCGNCDNIGVANVEQEFHLLGVKAMLTHGHTLHVKTTPLPLLYRAQELDARLVIFGHTHTPTLFIEDGRVFLNPGSLAYPRGYTVCTYAIAEFTREEQAAGENQSACRMTAKFSYYTLDGDRIPSFDLVHTF